METLRRKVEVPLNDEELMALGKQLASKETELQITIADAKAKAGEARAAVKEIRATIAQITGAIHSGHEMREVECERRVSASGKTEIVRLDTGAVVEVEDDEDDESAKQPRLPFRAAPELKFWARDVDGELHRISAEQRDVVVRELQTSRTVALQLGERAIEVEALQGNHACDVCGAADGNHRADMHAEADEDAEADDELEDYSEAADIAAEQLAAGERPENGDDAPPKAKRARKGNGRVSV